MLQEGLCACISKAGGVGRLGQNCWRPAKIQLSEVSSSLNPCKANCEIAQAGDQDGWREALLNERVVVSLILIARVQSILGS